MGTVMWANETLLDRLIVSADGQDVGMVDDLEISDGPVPEVSAFLSGPTALGPRIGDHLGIWWLSVGRRLRPTSDPYPNRVPVAYLKKIDHRGIALSVDAGDLTTRRLFDWANEKVVRRIPGNGS
jgi:hypothetical protein